MPIADWEWSYNGLIFGGGQIIGVVAADGIDPPNFKSNVVEKTGTHGASVFAEFYEERHVIITGDIMTTGTMETQVNNLRTAFTVRTNDIALTYQLPGVNRRRIMCRPMRLSVPVTGQYDIGYAEWTVELVASDPAIYDDTTSLKLFDG